MRINTTGVRADLLAPFLRGPSGAPPLIPLPPMDEAPLPLPVIEEPPPLPPAEPLDYAAMLEELRRGTSGETQADAARRVADDRARRLLAGQPAWPGESEPLPDIRVLDERGSEPATGTLAERLGKAARKPENRTPLIVGGLAFVALLVALSGAKRRRGR